ncbi:MAG: DUF1178 family protein [Pararhizobium sp.]
MIRFSLACAKGHAFEGWFSSNADFDRQSEACLVTCPACGTAHVAKSLMAPAVASARREEKPVRLAMSDEQRAAMAKLKEMVTTIKANADDVGERFPEEARKIHYGEADPCGIFGRASQDEARALLDEGIAVAPLPDFAEEAT